MGCGLLGFTFLFVSVDFSLLSLNDMMVVAADSDDDDEGSEDGENGEEGDDASENDEE